MPTKKEDNLVFRLFYGASPSDCISGCANDIGRFMQGMGLIRNIHYDTFPMRAIFQAGSFGMEIYNFSEDVGLTVLRKPGIFELPNTPLAIFGYHAVADYLKKNKKLIEQSLGRFKL